MSVNTKLDLRHDSAMVSLIGDIKTSMLGYMEIAHPEYTAADVDHCVVILEEYLTTLGSAADPSSGLDIVKKTVLKLNDLNEKSGGQLIETDQREMIAELIINAGFKKGFNTQEEDITEEWREW